MSKLSQLASVMIERTVPSQSVIGALIVFPKAQSLISPHPLSSDIALLTLKDETVWMLRVSGSAWTPSRLRTVAEALSRISSGPFSKAMIERLLQAELGTTSVSFERLNPNSVDISQWGVEAIACALAKSLSGRRAHCAPSEKPSSWTIEAALVDGLKIALDDFTGRMHPMARKLASATGSFDLRIYNYLAHSVHRRFRLQFAATFPGLLLSCVLAERGTLGAELRSIVDTGEPTVKGLARRWKVRPGVIRHLVGKSASHIGVQWSRDAMGLAMALNALYPQDLPSDNADDWREFNRIVAIGQRIFCRPFRDSAAGLVWLRECVHWTKRDNHRSRDLWLPDWAGLTRFCRFRDALTASLRCELAELDSRSANQISVAVDEAVDSFILTLADRGLAEIAVRFEDALDRIRADSVAEKIAAGEMMLPLIPGDFISHDRTRIVRPLITTFQLRIHGNALRNCLRSSYAEDYLRRGSTGMTFIVGTFDTCTGKALSTAEIQVNSRARGPTYVFLVKEHTAVANRAPSRRCVEAILELRRYCQTDEIRAHLEGNWRKIDLKSNVAVTQATKEVIGASVFKDLVAQAQNFGALQ